MYLKSLILVWTNMFATHRMLIVLRKQGLNWLFLWRRRQMTFFFMKFGVLVFVKMMFKKLRHCAANIQRPSTLESIYSSEKLSSEFIRSCRFHQFSCLVEFLVCRGHCRILILYFPHGIITTRNFSPIKLKTSFYGTIALRNAAYQSRNRSRTSSTKNTVQVVTTRVQSDVRALII